MHRTRTHARLHTHTHTHTHKTNVMKILIGPFITRKIRSVL